MIASPGARVLNAKERGDWLLVTVEYGAPTVLVERFMSSRLRADVGQDKTDPSRVRLSCDRVSLRREIW
jgi:hypothetical protein